MNTIKKIFANIDVSKTEELDDGTIKVWGYASAETEDSDGETITADAMKAALPDYMKFGAVREMHQAKAAGTAIEAEVQEDGKTWFGAHVVDSEAVKKVKNSVYKGFSIGGKVTERDTLNKAVIKGLKLIEVSLVDRPANPDAVFTMYKAETLDEVPNGDGISAVDALAELLNKGDITAEKLLELAKGEKCDDEEHDPAPDDDKVEKGMYSVQDFASVISTLGWICQDVQYESDWEGDNSPIPAQLRSWFATGIQIFRDMAAEETAELLAQLKTQAGEVDVIEMAARGIDLAKAGAKFSKSTKDALGAIHKAAQECCDHLGKLGYAEAEEDGKDADKAANGDDIAKVSGELDIAKADLSKLAAERDDLKKRVAELEAMPAPGKALLKSIAKSADAGESINDSVEKVDPVTDHKGDVNEVATLIKSIHSGKAA